MSLELPIYIKIRVVLLGLKYPLTISIKLGQIKLLGHSRILIPLLKEYFVGRFHILIVFIRYITQMKEAIV